MTTEKTPDHTERYEWLGNANEWKSCTHEEAIKLSNAKYEVREIWPFAHCTCPSGDGSLRHPCPSHPATLATVKHGGEVQLSTSERARFEAWAEDSYHLQRMGDVYRSAITTDAWRAWQAALAARQPVCATVKDSLTVGAHQPVGEVDEATVLRRAAAVLSNWEGDPNQTNYMGDFKDACQILEVLAQHAAPAAQAVDLGQFRPAVCAMGLYAEEPEEVDEAKRLLALIDSHSGVSRG